MEKLIEIVDGIPSVYGLEWNNAINLTINKGENPSIVGLNNAGKTLLAEIFSSRVALRQGSISFSFLPKGVSYKKNAVVRASFESAYLLADYNSMYYSQRFSASENDLSPTVKHILDDMEGEQETKKKWISKLRLENLFDKHLIMLSSGELRRFLIATILIKKPNLIIFDNPFIGLDAQMRAELDLLFKEIAHFQNMIFVVPSVSEIPTVSKSVVFVNDFCVVGKYDKECFVGKENILNTTDCQPINIDFLEPEHQNLREFENVAVLKNITIKYPNRTLFENFNWTIRRGEKWVLQGANGSGKSTLLSLITADNPRAYAMDITLFDIPRGSGESIWDIKKRIGYISPEMHLFFRENQTCEKIVASGLYDTQGLFRKCSEQQLEKARKMLALFNIEHLAQKSFLKISDGMQRLVLLARTMIKNPDLLILDEPLHGLDDQNRSLAAGVITRFCAQPQKTLVFVTHNTDEIPNCMTNKLKL